MRKHQIQSFIIIIIKKKSNTKTYCSIKREAISTPLSTHPTVEKQPSTSQGLALAGWTIAIRLIFHSIHLVTVELSFRHGVLSSTKLSGLGDERGHLLREDILLVVPPAEPQPGTLLGVFPWSLVERLVAVFSQNRERMGFHFNLGA